MRIFEILLLLSLAASLAAPLLLRRIERWMLLLNAAAIAILILHLFIEKYRWQMIPLYALAAIAALVALAGPASLAAIGRWRLAGSITGLVLLIPAALLPILLPVPAVPPPTGDYPVGTMSAMLVDTSRKELYSTDPNEPRAIMVQAWYPAKTAPGLHLSRWVDRPDVVAPSISRWLGFPEFFMDHVSLAKSHSLLDAPLVDTPDRLPVILFSHGWNGIRQQSTYLMEELASHGYMVVSIEHTYAARVVVFPDGRVAENNPSALQFDGPPEVIESVSDVLGNQWAEDIGFVLDSLAQWQAEGPFAGRLDLSRVGLSGHSTGGGAAIEFCGRDDRCKVILGFDPYLTPVSEVVINNGITQPAFLLFSELWPSEKNNALLGRLLTVSGNMDRASVMGTDHYDFSDLPLLSPLAEKLGLKGPLAAKTIVAISRGSALAVFDAALKGGDAGRLHALAAIYPELKFDYLP